MWGLGLLFMRVFYTKVIPDAALRDSYVAGLVLLAGAPCTAMVFVWSALMGGNSAFTLMQVAVNDVLMLALYVPICGLLIGASNIALPWDTIAVSVALFILAPLALATSVRVAVLHFRDEAYLLQRVVAPIKPLTTIALLATLILIFIFQGATLGTKTADIFLVAVPILIQSFALWGVCYAIAFYSCIPHERAGPASLIATSNFFELAVAVAISIYGPASGAALATVVGVLVEVPAMLFFVNVCNALKPVLDARCAACDDICPGYARAGDELLRVLLCGAVAPRAKPETAKAPAAPAVEVVAPRVCGCGPSGCA
jgi:ACR3 family arsenite transporter